MKEVIIFTDGSCKGPSGQKRAGCGVFFPKYEKYNISYKIRRGNITNQVAELKACVKGIEKVLSKIVFFKIVIYTDSMYLINSITSWADKWKENKWKKSNGEDVLNIKLIKKLYFYYKNLNIEFFHVKAHLNEPENKNTEDYKIWYGNFKADELANLAADKC